MPGIKDLPTLDFGFWLLVPSPSQTLVPAAATTSFPGRISLPVREVMGGVFCLFRRPDPGIGT